MTVYLVNLEEHLSYSYGVNDYILEVFDSKEKAEKFCQRMSGKEHEDYVIEDLSNLEPYKDIIGDISENNSYYEVYWFKRELL